MFARDPNDASRVETKNTTSAYHAPSSAPTTSLSFELIWKANSAYWAGELQTLDLYFNGRKRYTVTLPKGNNAHATGIPLLLSNPLFRFTQPEMQVLELPNLSSLAGLEFRVGVVRGNGILDDVSIVLSADNLQQFQVGKHYKIIITHATKRSSSFGWEGDGLHALIVEDGAYRQTIAPKPAEVLDATSTLTIHIGSSALAPPPGASFAEAPMPQSLITFKQRKDFSKNRDEVIFCLMVLEKKYEAAIEYASNKDTRLGGTLIIDLLALREELQIDVNAMNGNAQEQTPLHKAAIRKQFYAYHAILQGGGNKILADKTGKTPRDYHSENLTGNNLGMDTQRMDTQAMLVIGRYAFSVTQQQYTSPNLALGSPPIITSSNSFGSGMFGGGSIDRVRLLRQSAAYQRSLGKMPTPKTPNLEEKDISFTKGSTSSAENKNAKNLIETPYGCFFDPSNKASKQRTKPNVLKAFLFVGGTYEDREKKCAELSSFYSKLKSEAYENKEITELAVIFCCEPFEIDTFTFDEVKALAGQTPIAPILTPDWYEKIVQDSGVIDLTQPEAQLSLSNLSLGQPT